MIMNAEIRSLIVRQLNCWIWPGAMAEAALELKSAPPKAYENVQFQLVSGDLLGGYEGSYNQIIEDCVHFFSISDGLIELLYDLYPTYMSKEAEKVFRGFRFTGSLEFGKFPTNKHRHRTVAVLNLPCYQWRILEKPLLMITDIVGIKVAYWRELAQKGRSDELYHLETVAEWLLPVWVDILVGRSFGFKNLGAYDLEVDQLYHLGGYDPATAFFGPIPVSENSRRIMESQFVSPQYKPTVDREIGSELLNGFCLMERSKFDFGPQLNLHPYVNIFSPFSQVERVTGKAGKSFVVDMNYGLVYDEWFHRAPGLYGISDRLPTHPIDDQANYGFLRTPFRKIPRIAVDSQKQLENYITQIRKTCGERQLVFRGQNREYTILRSCLTKHSLFGDEEAIEPEILASAVREGIDVTGFMPEWSGYVNSALSALTEDIIDSLGKNQNAEILRKFYINLCSTYRFGHFSLALAQHYGLPSNGIDTSTALDIALCFALYSFKKSKKQTGRLDVRRLSPVKEPPVLYVFAIPSTKYQIRFKKIASVFGIMSRPAVQDACFIHTGWGFSQNDATRWLVAAFYLMEVDSFDGIPHPRAIFPNASNDFLGEILQKFSKNIVKSKKLGSYLDRFYWLNE